MNRLITPIITCFVTTACFFAFSVDIYGQYAVKVEYDYHFYTVRGYEAHRPMILTASNTRSKFYNPDTNRIDSICDTPEGRAKMDAYKNSVKWTSENMKNYPARWEKMYVEKDRSENRMTVYDTVAGEDRYCYDESLDGINWDMKDSTENILGFDCMMAECDYHGRHWTVWFTPEVPIADGPWKLNGLPGLVLKAIENSGQYEFTAVGIENYEHEIEPIYEKNLYSTIDRKELLQTKRLIDENMGGFISARTGGDHPKNMTTLKLKKEFDYIETDYR